jgi:hypothetical protein
MFYRIAASRLTLNLITLAILIGTAGIMTDQVRFLIDNINLDFVPGEVALEGSIAILVAAYGVFLERLGWLAERAGATIGPATELLNRQAHDAGNNLSLNAIFMEAVNLLALALDTWRFSMPALKFTEVSVLFAANLFAAGVVALFAVRAMRTSSVDQ